jgi:hypothetical protein
MGSESKYYIELLKKLEGFIRKDYLQLLLFGIQAFIAAVLMNFTFYAFIELIANFNSIIRTVLFILFILLVLGLLFFFLVKPILKYIGVIRKETYFDAAVKVGTNFPEVRDELVNSMQLISESEKQKLYSSNLIEASFKKVYERVKDLNFQSLINFERAKKILPYFGAVTLICVSLILFIPGMNAASYRLINFNQEFIPPPKFIFEITPGNKEITKGDELDITVKVIGSKPKSVSLALRKEEEADFSETGVIAGLFRKLFSRNKFCKKFLQVFR